MEAPETVIRTADGYDVYPEKGEIRSSIDRRKFKAGDLVGCKHSGGYVQFKMNGNTELVHRYVYETFHGVKLKSDQEINHIDLDKTNNSIANLEIVNHQQNNQWRNKQKNNSTGFKGVRVHRKNWQAILHHGGKDLCLGTFTTKEDAARAYNAKATELNETNDCKYKLNVI